MENQLFQISVVLIVKDNSPALLNADWATHHKLIPDGTTLRLNPTASVTTPAFSKLVIDDGYAISFEPNKVQCTHEDKDLNIESTKVFDISRRLIEVLSTFTSSAIGLNFRHVLTPENPTLFLNDALIKTKFKEKADHGILANGVKLSKDFGDMILNLSVDVGSIKFPDMEQEQAGLLLHANMHRALSEPDWQSQASEIVRGVNSDYERLIKVLDLFLSEG